MAQNYYAGGWDTTTVILAGLVETVQSGAKVINFSIGCSKGLEDDSKTYTFERIKEQAKQPSEVMGRLLELGYDFVVVQSSGNGAKNEVGVDAIYNGIFSAITNETCVEDYKYLVSDIINRIIIVGAVELGEDGTYIQTTFSNGGTRVDIVAPGDNIYTTSSFVKAGYSWCWTTAGTSFSAPMVTGVTALVWSIDPTFTGAEVKSIICDIRSTSEPVADNPGSPHTSGEFRMLNAYKAVKFALTQSLKKQEKLDALVGTYKGSYMASQGETALTLTVLKVNNEYIAQFEFDNLLGRKNAKEGAYYMDVSYDLDAEEYYLKASEWIDEVDYSKFDLKGTLSFGVLCGDLPTKFKVTRVENYKKPEEILDALVGLYRGTFELSQGTAYITLNIYKDGTEYKASCDLESLPDKTNIDAGSFVYIVSYSELNKDFLFEGDKCIEQPLSYLMPMLQGYYKDNAIFGDTPTKFKVEREKDAITPASVEEAIDVHFQVAITGLGKTNWHKFWNGGDEYTLTDIVEENKELLLKAAPESEWLSFPWVYEGQTWKDSASTYIGFFYDYKMPSFNYNAGADFEISYKITNQEKINSTDLIALNVSLAGADLVRSNSVSEGYKVTVEYILNGSKGTYNSEGIYIVVKTDNYWRVFLAWNTEKIESDNGWYNAAEEMGTSIYWDNTLQNVLSQSWHP